MLDGISQELLVNAVQIALKSYLYIKRSTEGEHAWEYRRIMQARIRSMMYEIPIKRSLIHQKMRLTPEKILEEISIDVRRNRRITVQITKMLFQIEITIRILTILNRILKRIVIRLPKMDY